MDEFAMQEVYEESYQPTSTLQWFIEALGPFYGLMIPLSALVIFLGACLVVFLSRRPVVIASYLVFVPFPFLLGTLGFVHGAISSFQVIAMSPVAPKPAEIGMGISTSLVAMFLGLLLTFPAYFVVSLGLFIRAIQSKPPYEK